METLLEKLVAYSKTSVCPMHMPGHKRRVDMAEYLGTLGAGIDITEIAGFDNLHKPEGILKNTMELASQLWDSEKSFFLVNGSTCGILAGIRAATKRGDSVLVARNCHISIYHALEICGLRPVFYMPPVDPQYGVFGSVVPGAIDILLGEHPEITLVILTSPTYEGVISDIPSICAYAHSRNIPVLVDEAHGAHLGFFDYFPGGAVKAGADIVIQSLHKTLPSLTQTAIAHVNGVLVKAEELQRQLSIFETSSPSYLLLASMDGCVHLLLKKKGELFRAWRKNLVAFDKQILPLCHLRVLCHGSDKLEGHPELYAFDPSKIIISTAGTGITGARLLSRLREDYSIELEMAYGDYAIAMTGLGDTDKSLATLSAALLDLDAKLKTGKVRTPYAACSLPEAKLSIEEALSGCSENVTPDEAVERISVSYLWAYPPGIPMLIPGEVITADIISGMKRLENSGIRITDTGGSWPNGLTVLD